MEKQKHFNFGQLALVVFCAVGLLTIAYLKNGLHAAPEPSNKNSEPSLSYQEMYEQATGRATPNQSAQVLGSSTQNIPPQPIHPRGN